MLRNAAVGLSHATTQGPPAVAVEAPSRLHVCHGDLRLLVAFGFGSGTREVGVELGRDVSPDLIREADVFSRLAVPARDAGPGAFAGRAGGIDGRVGACPHTHLGGLPEFVGVRIGSAGSIVGSTVGGPDSTGEVGAPVQVRTNHPSIAGDRHRRRARVEVTAAAGIDVDVFHVAVVVVRFQARLGCSRAALRRLRRRMVCRRGQVLRACQQRVAGGHDAAAEVRREGRRRVRRELVPGATADEVAQRRVRPLADPLWRRECRAGRKWAEKERREHPRRRPPLRSETPPPLGDLLDPLRHPLSPAHRPLLTSLAIRLLVRKV